MTRRRDPDALPPSNAFQHAMHWIHDMVSALGRGNALFALKAGLLTVILSIPSFLKSTAAFAYGTSVYISRNSVRGSERLHSSTTIHVGHVRPRRL